MPSADRIAAMTDEISAWRRDFHANPELLYDVHRTAGIVAEKLKSFGCDEVVPGIGRTGVVGVIRGRTNASGKVIGMRADMDALPIEEQTNLPYRSKVAGKMHACGHDGHTAMLLGAAKYLAETRDFDGTAVVIFQPAEEGGAGGEAMVKDGMMERFGIQEVYGMHNMPGLPVGAFALRPGPLLAAADRFIVTIEGRGGHAAKPHETIDTVLVTTHIITALQSIVSRNADPLEAAVVSVTSIHAGETFNVIPQTAQIKGTVRTLTPAMRDLCEERFRAIVTTVAQAFGASAAIEYNRGYPITWNHPEQTAFAAGVAGELVGAEKVDTAVPPTMGGEDFSFMLEARPGAFIFVGNGDTAGLHHPAYDFNDDVIPVGVGYWARLAETAMPLR
ncbi:M20 aminoacylase family protein [Chelatococcus sp. SYSU_G07232]|uniref:M20 aminoacylase family protein n=1 Tax=Chelatococcus albus TaxID=3047466 RepID=A0ABT7AHT4_9HYPH|nr:M20 aminoacylase family protein [Chelatococcus sp. SYSU_G07232]MDJ1158939.1 M20 aminoacylase family protein [Chelatococcus sp. SYSU_G07232]